MSGADSLNAAAGAANIGTFGFQVVALIPLLTDAIRLPAGMTKKARGELNSALDILKLYDEVMDDELLSNLMNRYDRWVFFSLLALDLLIREYLGWTGMSNA